MYQFLLYNVSEGVCTIALNRPEVYHALSPELIEEITQAVVQAGEDATVRVLVLTATGEKAFCTGADLKAGMNSGMGLGDSLRKRYNPMILAMRHLPKPIVCRLNGIAAGAGCSLALAADVIVASNTAYLCQIFVNIGLIPDAGSTFFLPRLVGAQKAFELASTGRKVMAEEAQTLGLINKAVAPEALNEAVAEYVNYYKTAPTQAIGLMKAALNKSLNSDLTTILNTEADGQDIAGKSNDFAEGVTAFLLKRQANYTGH